MKRESSVRFEVPEMLTIHYTPEESVSESSFLQNVNQSKSPEKSKVFDKELGNIILLGIGFMFSMGSYTTCAASQVV